MGQSVIVAGFRTPIGRLGGGLSSLNAAELGGKVIEATLNQVDFEPAHVDEVIMGTVLQGGQGQIPSRQAASMGGIPFEVATETINKVCASGMRAVTFADQIIRAGDAKAIIAGGMESMSNAPYFVKGTRFGTKMGHTSLLDLMIHDGLTCAFHGGAMGNYGNRTAELYEISREEQDKWSYRSHKLAIEAMESGVFAKEIIPITISSKKGMVTVQTDEGPRKDSTLEKLLQLKPAFDKSGTITAGNAPSVNDGAACLFVMDEDYALELGYEPLGKIVAHTAVGVAPEDFPITPGIAINKLLEKTNKTVDDIALFEINEAFSVVALASMKIAGIPQEKVNVNGGAVALGHPIGASGARIILTLLHELKRKGGGLGIAAICSGGGQGDAVLLEV